MNPPPLLYLKQCQMGISSRISSGHSERQITLPSRTPPLTCVRAPRLITGDTGQPRCSGMWSLAEGKGSHHWQTPSSKVAASPERAGDVPGASLCATQVPTSSLFYQGFSVLGKLLWCLSFPTKYFKRTPHCSLS